MAKSGSAAAKQEFFNSIGQTSPFVSAASSGGKAPIGAVPAIMI
jgi:hypothetical protein